MASAETVRVVSSCRVKPMHLPKEAEELLHLTPWDLPSLTGKYIQSGLLFSKPTDPMPLVLNTLKHSLSRALVHFFPLAGRLATAVDDQSSTCSLYIDCTNPPGAEFIHSVADDVTVDDILSSPRIPPIVKSLFLYGEAVNHDGHSLPLLAVQVTELVDGFFVGCSFNHSVADGTSFWHFLNQWTEISRSKEGTEPLSRPPLIKRFFLESYGPITKLPISDATQALQSTERIIPSGVVERVFHFSAKSLAQIKAKAVNDITDGDVATPVLISTFQSLCGLIWTSVMKARKIPLEQTTIAFLLINNRSRLDPPLSPYYFGNCAYSVYSYTSLGELLKGGIGCAARMINEKVQAHNDGVVRELFEGFIKEPKFKRFTRYSSKNTLVFSGSIRFDAYENDFGWGKPLALRNGLGSKFDGKVATYPAREGGGSADVMMCFSPETMAELEKDEEFMAFVS